MTNVVHPDCPLYHETFELLAKKETLKFYLAHQNEFDKYVIQPTNNIVDEVISQLSNYIIEQLDIQHCVSNKPSENRYECCFYIKNYNNNNAHFFLTITNDNFYFGFFISKNSDDKQKFIRNYLTCRDLKEIILQHTHIESDCTLHSEKKLDRINRLGDWLKHLSRQNSKTKNIQASVHIKKVDILQCSIQQLAIKIKSTFEGLFPLMLVATSNDPVHRIRVYIDSFRVSNIKSVDSQNTNSSNISIEIAKSIKVEKEYSLSQCAKDTGYDEAKLKRWLHVLNRKGQIILCGSPGSGKTFIAESIARSLIAGSDAFWELIQFHAGYSYEDFVQGIRPQSEDGDLTYPLLPGRFIEFCEKAETCQDTCVLIIDEINRANLSQVFGELMYLLEYRDREIPLATGGMFRIPKNVRIIGTMNTADRSIALVDYALRRRFAFIEIRPNYEVLRQYHQKTGFAVDGLIQVLQQVNQSIADKNFEIGISFFLTESLEEDIEDIWCMEIEPYLEEFFFNQLDKVSEFRWQKVQHIITV